METPIEEKPEVTSAQGLLENLQSNKTQQVKIEEPNTPEGQQKFAQKFEEVKSSIPKKAYTKFTSNEEKQILKIYY